jgi:hypothetical protein
LFWAVTIVNCPREIPGHRFQHCVRVGANGKTQLPARYRRRRFETPSEGSNVLRAAVVNGDGATDHCARLLDAENRPLKGISVSLAENVK